MTGDSGGGVEAFLKYLSDLYGHDTDGHIEALECVIRGLEAFGLGGCKEVSESES